MRALLAVEALDRVREALMAAVLHLAPRAVTQDEVLRAWHVHRSLILAEVDDPRLLDDAAHQAAKDEARERYFRLFNEWCST
jgi:hypothetical protein